MVKLYVKRILAGLMTSASVPVKWREDVAMCFQCVEQIRRGELEFSDVAKRLQPAVQEILDFNGMAVA